MWAYDSYAHITVHIIKTDDRIPQMSIKFRFEISRYCKKIVVVYFLPHPVHTVSSINLKVCCVSSGISGTNIFMILRKWCHQNARFFSWNGTNFNFGWCSAYDNAFVTLLWPLYAASAAAFIVISSTYIYIYDNHAGRSSRTSRKTKQ